MYVRRTYPPNTFAYTFENALLFMGFMIHYAISR